MTDAVASSRTPPKDPRTMPGAWSIPATRRRVLELLEGIDWRSGRIVDVGAGSGLFSRVLCELMRNVHGLEPARVAIDLVGRHGLC